MTPATPAGAGTAQLPGGLRQSQRLLLVSYLAHEPFAPRAVRTRELLSALRREWTVELIAPPAAPEPTGPPRRGPSLPRRIGRLTHSAFLLDKFEPWSRGRFGTWRPDATGALLVGFPFSPVVYAARKLREYGIPYIVDAGDPWILTNRWPEVRLVARVRAARAERALWEDAAGAVLTTPAQARALQELFPGLPILVRPNGFTPVEAPRLQAGSSADRRDKTALKLAHFGDITVDRIDVRPWLSSLVRSGHWVSVEVHQYGSDWTGRLASLADVSVTFHHPREWAEIVQLAPSYDAAVVIGNRDRSLLPSKTVPYLQLPIPRFALTKERAADALIEYVRQKPGWLVVDADDAATAERVLKHVRTDWTSEALEPPESESWECVADEVARFIRGTIAQRLAVPRRAEA